MTDFELAGVTVERPGAGVVLRDLTWAVRAGQTWAVTGPAGSGKTTLAETVLGRVRPSAGAVRVPPHAAVRLVGFREDSRHFAHARHYYQQRFDFVEPHDDLTLADYLRGGLAAGDAEVSAAAGRLGVGHLLGSSFLQLSTGQARRARIARGLLARPDVLFLDDPFLGLDAAGRGELADLLGEVARGGATRLVLLTRPDAVPGWVTDVLELPGPPGCGAAVPAARSEEAGGTPAPQPAARGSRCGAAVPAARIEEAGGTPAPQEPVVELRDVSVAYGPRTVLDRVTWTVRAGERWAVLGPNGSGKSTLLSLLCGDHPQAYANDVRLFGRRRGTGETIWDVKRRVGLLSGELHLYFTEPLTAAEAVATGFHDVLARRPVAPEQAAAVRALLAEFGVGDLGPRPFRQLSTGQQRLVLLARALVKRPPLVVLDEPFQGLDAATAARARDWLDGRLGDGQTLLFVSHLADEVPRSVTHTLRLDAGRATVDAP